MDIFEYYTNWKITLILERCNLCNPDHKQDQTLDTRWTRRIPFFTLFIFGNAPKFDIVLNVLWVANTLIEPMVRNLQIQVV